MADNDNNSNDEKKEEKIEVCYTCGKEFDMNSRSLSLWRISNVWLLL